MKTVRLSLATIVLGLVAGLGAIGFHFLADRFGQALFAEGRNHFPMVVVIPTLGLFVVRLVLSRFPERRRGGVAEALDSITLGSGAVGGLFAPTLVMGAMFGGAFGYGFHAIAPKLVPQPELMVLVGMVVMFSSIVKGFWSGILLVADMSGAYHALILPGLLAGGIAFLLSWQLHDRSVFGLSINPRRKPSPLVAQSAEIT